MEKLKSYSTSDSMLVTVLCLLCLLSLGLAAAPVVTLESYPLTYSAYNAKQSTKFINDTAILLTKTATITDADGDNLEKVEVEFAQNFVYGDTLSVTDTASITGGFDSATGKLTLTGPTTTANFQAALRTVYFKASSTYDFYDVPNYHNKVVKVVATDVNSDASVDELRAINITMPARVFTEWVTMSVQQSND
mmetsp:Transcript_11755/g.23721  ORF Transcript_11755/g.23721 Transcript_11755/m.23721 type:complete len:193 (-) Transcript_11755:27-605(-)